MTARTLGEFETEMFSDFVVPCFQDSPATLDGLQVISRQADIGGALV